MIAAETSRADLLALLDAIPGALLLLDGERIAHANPAAADLLGGSIFDLLDRPLARALTLSGALGARDCPAELPDGRALWARVAPSPTPQLPGRLLALRPAGEGAEPAAGEADDAAEAERARRIEALGQQLSRAAAVLPAGMSRLTRRELVRALVAARRLTQHAEDEALASLLAESAHPGEADVALETCLRDALIELESIVHFAGLEIEACELRTLRRVAGNRGLIGRAVEELLIALATAAPDSKTTIDLPPADGGGYRLTLRGAPIPPPELAAAIAGLHGGELTPLEDPPGLALCLPAAPPAQPSD